MRLATFEVITGFQPIEGKDKIEIAQILGYEVVVKKDQFKVGDWCVYIFPDTVADATKPYLSFLCRGGKKHDVRINVSKVGGVYSQGLVLPLSDLSEVEGFPDPNSLSDDELTTLDLGPLLGITKYEKDAASTAVKSKDGKVVQSFPEFPFHYIPITDEENLRSIPKILNELIDRECDITVKQDGSSMTLIWDNDIFYVCSRRISLYKVTGELDENGNEKPEYEYISPMVTFVKDKQLRDYFRGRRIVIQGEFCGPKINGNKLMLTKFQWYIFTVFTFSYEDGGDSGRIKGTYVGRDDFHKIYFNNELFPFCSYGIDIHLVPLFDRMTVTSLTTKDDFIRIAEMVRYKDPNGTKEVLGEGIVVRPTIPFRSRTLGKNCSFKIVNKEYKD